MEKIVFLDRETVQAEFRPPAFAHRWISHPSTRADEVVDRLQGATVAITNKVPLRAEAIARLPDLKLVAVAATGVDVVDVAACEARGIGVANVRGYAKTSVPEHVMMLALALSRSLPGYQADVQAGAWARAESFCLFSRPIRDLGGRTLGLVGAGDLGCRVARLAEAFGMRVLVSERKGAESIRAGRTPFEQVLAASDVLTLHCPLTAQTRHLIGAAELARMPRHALLINTARGGLIDERALAEALVRGEIGGAGLDVLSEEPPRNGNPLLALRLPNLIVTPHVAWASREAMQALADQVVANIEAFMAGERVNRVDRSQAG